MRTQTTAFRVVLIALMLSALACNTIMGGTTADDAEATADALLTQAVEDFGDPQATADALATEAAETLDDFATPEDAPDDVEPTEDSGDIEEEPTEEEGAPQGSDDIPVFDGNNENFFQTEGVVSYTTDGTYDDVVAFYRAEMEARGWAPDTTLSTEFAGTAVLLFNKDNQLATVTISPDPSSGKLLVLINIANT